MSEEQQDAAIGRTLKEFQSAKKKLAALNLRLNVPHKGRHVALKGKTGMPSHQVLRQSRQTSRVGIC
jgi:hypothetical protein